jgi:hypothetical protein
MTAYAKPCRSGGPDVIHVGDVFRAVAFPVTRRVAALAEDGASYEQVVAGESA